MEEFLKEEWTKYLISDYCVNKAFLKPPFELKPPDKIYSINGTEFREYTNDRADNELVHYTVREEELTDSDRERENKKLAEVTDKPNADFSVTKVVNGVMVNSEAFISDYSWNTVVDLGDHYRCVSCDTVLKKEEVDNHIKSEGHRNALEKCPPMAEHKLNVVRKIRTHYHCSICNVIVTVKINEHLESTNHLQFYIFAFNKASQLSVKPKSIDNNAPVNNNGPAHYQMPPVFHNGPVHQHNQPSNNFPPYFNNLMPHILNYQQHAYNNINGFNYYNPMFPNAPNIRPSMNNLGPYYNNIRPVVNNSVVYNNRPVAPGMWPGPNVFGYVNNGPVYNAPVNTGPINVPDKNNGIIGNTGPVNNTPVNNSVPDNGIVSNNKDNGAVDSVNKSVDETVAKNVMSYASAAKKQVEPDYVLHVNDRNVVKVKFNSWHMIISSKNKTFYCMACKDKSIENKLEHCNSAEHMIRVQQCPIVDAFEDYFIRKVDDKFYHCGLCNNLKFPSDIKRHIRRSHSHTNKTTDNVKVGKSNPQNLIYCVNKNDKTTTAVLDAEKSMEKAKTVNVAKDATSVAGKGTTLINDKGTPTPLDVKVNATSVNDKANATPIDKTNAVSSNVKENATPSVKGNATPVEVKANATTDAIRTTASPGPNKKATREAESPEVVKVTAEPVKYNFFRKTTNVFTSEIKICPFDMELKINLLSYNTVFSHADNLVCGLCDSLVSKEDPVHHICGTVHTEILRCTPFIYNFNNNLIREIRDRLHCAICNVFMTHDNIFNHIMNPPHTTQFTKAMGSDKSGSQASPGPGAFRPPTPASNVPMQAPNLGSGHMPASNMPCPGNMACHGNMPGHMFGWWPSVPGMPLPNPMLPVTPFPTQVPYPVWPYVLPPRCPVPPLIMPVQNPVQTHLGQHPAPAKTPDGTEDSSKHLKKAESPGTNVHAPEFTPPSNKLIEALKVNESNKTNESSKTSDSHKTTDSDNTSDSKKTTDSHKTESFEETKVNTKKIDSNVIKEIAKVKEKAARSTTCVKIDIIEEKTIPKLKGATKKLDMNVVKSDPIIGDIIVKREVLDEVSREVSKIISEEKDKNAKKASETKKESFLCNETQDDGEVAKLLSEINKINLDTNFFEETNAGGLSPPNDPKPIAKETLAVIESIWGDSLMSPSLSEKTSNKFTFADIEKSAKKDNVILDTDKCFFKLNDQLSLEDKLLPPPSLDKEKVTIDLKISEANIEVASKNTIFTPNNGLVAKIPSLDQNKVTEFDANSIGLTPIAPNNSLTTKPIDKKKIMLTYDENAPIKIIRTGTPENLSVENKSFDDNKIKWEVHETTTAKATISKPGHNGVIARKSKLEKRKIVEHKEKSPKTVLSVAGVENVVPNETVLDKKEIIFEPLNTGTKKATIAFDPTISKPEKKNISWEEDKKTFKEVLSTNNLKVEEPPLDSVKTSRVSSEESPNIPKVILEEKSKTNTHLKDDETSGKNNIKSNGNKKISKKTTSATKDDSIDITEPKLEPKNTDDKIQTPKEVETTPLETIDDDISSVNESSSDVNEITLDLNEPYDTEEYIYLKLRDVMFKISFSAYNSLVPVGDGNRCCFVCWEQVMYQDMKHHIASSKHEENMRSSKFMYHYKLNLVRWNNSAYHCGVCNVIVTCGMQKHLAWQYHNFQMDEIKRSPRQLARDLKKGEIKQIRPLMTKKVYTCTNPPKMTTIPCENIF